VDKTWRHRDFFQHRALLHARLPRVRCPEHGVRQVSVPWARPGSGFTLLFEALVLSFAAAMPMAKVGAMTREHDTRIWRIVEHHVNAARDQLDCSGVRRVGMDETSAAKGQDYVSIFADLDARRVVFATEGRSADTVGRFAADLAEQSLSFFPCKPRTTNAISLSQGKPSWEEDSQSIQGRCPTLRSRPGFASSLT
jgi:transposase